MVICLRLSANDEKLIESLILDTIDHSFFFNLKMFCDDVIITNLSNSFSQNTSYLKTIGLKQ